MHDLRMAFHSPEAYDRYIGRYSPALARELIAAAGVRSGMRVLDVGCGPGPLTAAIVAAGCETTAVDPSLPFATACAERNPTAQVEVAPAEEIPFDDDSFDAALAQLVVNFMQDPVAGVGQMRRVTRPGGTVGAAVWDYGGAMTLLRTFWDAAVALDSSAPDEESMRNATPSELATLWTTTGLTGVTTGEAIVRASYSGFEDLWAPFEAGVGPAGGYAVSLDEDSRAALKDQMRRRLDVAEEPFDLTARAFIVTGRA
jgi:ubiquinone/menaquinone biosynthesis C-methylase UbiE